MRKAYRILGWVIAGLVMLQAASLAWGARGEGKFVEDGGVIDKALIEAAQSGGEPPFPEVLGFLIPGINGGMLIPLLAVALLAVSFGARLTHARRNAGIVLGLVGVQIMLGYSIGDLPALGFLHGLNALLVFAAALAVARHTEAPGPRSAMGVEPVTSATR